MLTLLLLCVWYALGLFVLLVALGVVLRLAWWVLADGAVTFLVVIVVLVVGLYRTVRDAVSRRRNRTRHIRARQAAELRASREGGVR